MSRHSNPDPQAFQQLLSNAFAVQQSQLDPEALSVFVEIQRLVARRDIDVIGTMNLVVESARCVANAAGVAIGLVERDQLIYKAASGSAAADVDRHLRASLTASADSRGNREILRVENADEDTRIQAAICRQLGAKSLLMLSIYRQRVLAGVLEVRFGEPHSFGELEVRTYRLMAALIEDALFQASQIEQTNVEQTGVEQTGVEQTGVEQTHLEQARERNPEVSPVTDAFDQIAPQGGMLFASRSLPEPSEAFYHRFGEALATLWQSQVLSRPATQARMFATRLPHTITMRAKNSWKEISWKDISWNKGHRGLALAGVAGVLALTGWVGYKSRGPAASLSETSAPPAAVTGRQTVLQPTKPAAAGVTSTLVKPAPGHSIKPTRAAGQPVRVSANEIDYVRGDVTVRHFTHKPAAQVRAVAKRRVAHIGDDVTVRYFAAEPALRSATKPALRSATR